MHANTNDRREGEEGEREREERKEERKEERLRGEREIEAGYEREIVFFEILTGVSKVMIEESIVTRLGSHEGGNIQIGRLRAQTFCWGAMKGIIQMRVWLGAQPFG